MCSPVAGIRKLDTKISHRCLYGAAMRDSNNCGNNSILRVARVRRGADSAVRLISGSTLPEAPWKAIP
jgi:hypothetical protein